MRSTLAVATLCGALLCAAAPLSGQTAGVSLTVGTNGPGARVSIPVASKLNVRLAGNYFSYPWETETEFEGDGSSSTSVAFETDAKLQFVGGLIDWHPGAGAFRLTAGAFHNGLAGNGNIHFLEPYTVNGEVYTPEEIGELAIEIDFDSKIAPYVGMGFGNAVNSRVGFTMDLGAMYVGAPAVAMHGEGMLAPTAKEAAQIEENLNWVKVYPVFSIGLSARLF